MSLALEDKHLRWQHEKASREGMSAQGPVTNQRSQASPSSCVSGPWPHCSVPQLATPGPLLPFSQTDACRWGDC